MTLDSQHRIFCVAIQHPAGQDQERKARLVRRYEQRLPVGKASSDYASTGLMIAGDRGMTVEA